MAKNTDKKASRKDWHPADIKAELEKAGWTLRALAAHHQLKSSSTLSHTFERSYPLNERRIAEAIGVEPKDIWPSRYNEDGSKKPRGIRAISTRKSTQYRCQRNGNELMAA
ncbi:MAG: helix-turn-helix domain-containing protein [Pseudomonadota bacterium]|jgi:Ner family transcriptional regulator